MSLNSQIALALTVTQAGTAPLTGGIAPEFDFSEPNWLAGTLTDGTGADKNDQFYSTQVTLCPSEAFYINLHTMAVNGLTAPTDALGGVISVATIKALFLKSVGNLNCYYVSAAAINAAGSGYSTGSQTLTLVGGNYLGAVVIHSAGGGSAYVVGDILTIAGGTGTAATVKVLTVSSGAILTLAVLTRGAYSANPTTSSNAATGGTGTGASLDLTMCAGVVGQLTVTVAAGAVTVVDAVLVAGSYVVAPPTTGCTVTGGGGTGATFNLTLAQRTRTNAVFTDTDVVEVGGTATSAGWTSWLKDNSDIVKLRGGSSNLPGFVGTGGGSSTGLAVGSSSTNNQLKLSNVGSNPVTMQIVVAAASA